jgi:hypothetical protein
MGDHPAPTFFSASSNEETRLCNADPVVQAASAEFLTCKRVHVGTDGDNSLILDSDHHRNWYSQLFDDCVLGICERFRHSLS